jgi:hypothetical protein
VRKTHFCNNLYHVHSIQGQNILPWWNIYPVQNMLNTMYKVKLQIKLYLYKSKLKKKVTIELLPISFDPLDVRIF